MVDEKTGQVVEGDNKGRGYELSKGKYVEIEPEELEAVDIESRHTIDIDRFLEMGVEVRDDARGAGIGFAVPTVDADVLLVVPT